MSKQSLGRLILLSEAGSTASLKRFVCGLPVKLTEGLSGDAPQTWVTVTRTGRFTDPRYGEFEISRALLEEIVRNFDANTYGQKIFLDVAHKPNDGAAAEILKLKIEGDRLRALVAWTPFGIDAVKNKGFRYLSAEYHENFIDNETGKPHGCVLQGAGLVTRPCIKRLDPVQLSEQTEGDGAAILLHPTLLSELMNEVKNTMNKHIEALRKQLEGKKLSEAAIASIVAQAEKALTGVADESVQKALCEGFAAAAVQLAENSAPVSLTVQGLGAADVEAAVAKALAARDDQAKKLAESLAAKQKLLSDTIASKGQALPDEARKQLTESLLPAISGDMSDAAVIALADVQVQMGQQIHAQKLLADQGFAFRGTAHIEVPSEASTKMSGMVREALKKTDAVARGALRLSETDSPFIAKVLGQFDAEHGSALSKEHKALSGGDASFGDYYFPAGVQREVIRVALSDLNVLSLVRTNVDPTAQATTEIPFEVRPAYNAGNDGVVYEGGAIPRYQTRTDHETAFITPMKIGMQYTNELAHFTRRGAVNWDAVAENLAANSRTHRELVSRRIANELQRSADSYGAIAVANENISAQLAGASSVIKTANFPVVRPFQPRNLKGEAQGSAQNPITVTVNGTAIAAWDGSGKQAAGTYWRGLSFNMGYIQFVDKDGNPVTPTHTAGATTISYSRATNVVKVDLDVPNGKTLEQHLNKVLQAIGAQKALLSGQRFVNPDFALMSPTLNDVATNAESFVDSMKRNGTDTTGMGDLATVKGLPAFGTNQPGIDLGDERILIAPRGLLGYTISKPFAIEGQPFEVVDASGYAIGTKQVYGEEYNAIHVPTPVRGYLTSVLCYSAGNR